VSLNQHALESTSPPNDGYQDFTDPGVALTHQVPENVGICISCAVEGFRPLHEQEVGLFRRFRSGPGERRLD